MAGCIQHNFRRCTEKELSCAVCCAQTAECGNFWYEPLVGSANNLQVGDKLWMTNACSGEGAPAGIYTDCGPEGACTQPEGETRIYGCVTIDASSLVTAITPCTGDVSCGSGAGSNCNQAGTIETDKKVFWTGRQKIKVGTLDTWETLYEAPKRLIYDTASNCYSEGETFKGYLKQIYIHNCDLGAKNEKKFSVRIYNSSRQPIVISDCVIAEGGLPAEFMIADRMKLDDNERVVLLGHEVPLKLHEGDVIDVQSHTSLDGFTISAWIEFENQNWSEHIPITQAIVNDNAEAQVGNNISLSKTGSLKRNDNKKSLYDKDRAG